MKFEIPIYDLEIKTSDNFVVDDDNLAYLKINFAKFDPAASIIYVDDLEEEKYAFYRKIRMIDVDGCLDNLIEEGLYLKHIQFDLFKRAKITLINSKTITELIEKQVKPAKLKIYILKCLEIPDHIKRINLNHQDFKIDLSNQLKNYPIMFHDRNGSKLVLKTHNVKLLISFNFLNTDDEKAEVYYGLSVNGAHNMEKAGFLTQDIIDESELVINFDGLDDKDKYLFQKVEIPSIFKGNFNFEEMGIGGLDQECRTIFKRVFASRACNKDLRKNLNIIHIKGLLFHGPPGCGKTLIARKMSEILDGHPPKIVNGPELLDQYIGNSEKALREVFQAAQKEWVEKKEESKLHVIVFDEMDALFPKRRSNNSGSQVMSRMVNQLLAIMDGVDSIDNILVIGMTNRLDIIDPALLRPGRFEIQMKINLPDFEGRKQILKIHTKNMSDNECLDDDIDLDKLSRLSENFTGAELASLARSAAHQALDRHLKECHLDNNRYLELKIKITMDDFIKAFHDVKPQFKKSESSFDNVLPSSLNFNEGNGIREFIDQTLKLIDTYSKGTSNKPFKLALHHPDNFSGKTTLATKIVQESIIGQSNYLSNMKMIGEDVFGKCNLLKEYFLDSLETETSIIIIDDLEKIANYNPSFGKQSIGSIDVIQTMKTLFSHNLPKNKKVIFLMTYKDKEFVEGVGLKEYFDGDFKIPAYQDVQA